ncbi:hypothetical protein [Kitasatospora cinereorecta]|uniref:Uncharacterized protein n=1 Tax=Kitasatospora cinereorecta TaxID=285560 RepID=A0ABW0V6X2_9ACTN
MSPSAEDRGCQLLPPRQWQRESKHAEDELDDPRALALLDWGTLDRPATSLVLRSHGHYGGWGDIVRFAAYGA